MGKIRWQFLGGLRPRFRARKKKRRGRPNQCVILPIPMQRIERDQLIPGAQRPRFFKKPPKKVHSQKNKNKNPKNHGAARETARALTPRTTARPARPRARFARQSRPLEVGVATAATAVCPIVAAAVAASSGRATSCPLLAKCCQKTRPSSPGARRRDLRSGGRGVVRAHEEHRLYQPPFGLSFRALPLALSCLARLQQETRDAPGMPESAPLAHGWVTDCAAASAVTVIRRV